MESLRRDWQDLRARLNPSDHLSSDKSIPESLEDLARRATTAIPATPSDAAVIIRIGIVQLGIDLDEDTLGHTAIRNGLRHLE